jgi:hypothetical protein
MRDRQEENGFSIELPHVFYRRRLEEMIDGNKKLILIDEYGGVVESLNISDEEFEVYIEAVRRLKREKAAKAFESFAESIGTIHELKEAFCDKVEIESIELATPLKEKPMKICKGFAKPFRPLRLSKGFWTGRNFKHYDRKHQ